MSDHVTRDGSGMERGRRPVLSSAQRRLWFVDQLRPGRVAYNVPFAYWLRGPVDRDALAAALRYFVRRHEVVRSRFPHTKGEPYLVVDDPTRFEPDFLDVSDSSDPATAALTVAREDGDRPFDLAAGPLFRATVIRVADDEHLLSITTHHIVFDGLSRRPFEQELSAAYLAYLHGKVPDLPALGTPFFDHVARSAEGSQDIVAEDLAYWRDRLHGASHDLPLPTSSGRTRVTGEAAGVVTTPLPAAVAHNLTARARGARATLFTITLAAFHALLGRYTGAEDIIIGTPTAGRSDPELDNAIGYFTDTVPIRVVSGRTATFAQLVATVREAVLGALDHDAVPLARLLEVAGSARSTGADAPFRVWFDIFTPSSGLDLGGVLAPSFDPATPVTRFDLELHVKIRQDGALDLRLLYRSELFDPQVVEGFARYYRAFLTAVADDFDVPVGTVPIMSRAERGQLVREAGGIRLPVDDKPLPVRFEEQVRAHPHAPAVSDGEVVLSYAELNERADRLADVLRSHGARSRVVVGLFLPRGLDCVTALLAIVKTGAAYLAIDAELPTERIHFMLTDSGARLVVTTSELHAAVQDGPPAILLDAPPRPPRRPVPVPPVCPVVDAATYVIYTSGSTGRPKGIAMPGRALSNVLAWQLSRSVVSGPTAQFSSISFDPSFLEVFATWLAGGLLVLVPEDVRRDPERLFDRLVAGGVRRLFCPPQVVEQLAQVAAGRHDLPPLTQIVPAGEQLRISPAIRALVGRLRAAGHDVVVDNEYGPNETQIVTAYRLDGDPGRWPDAPPIGRAIPNCQAHLLDPDLQPVPPGVLGEVYLGGRCVSDGYVARFDTTADRFVPDPFSDRPGSRLYRTGDLARRDGDGELTFAGRADHQVKIRGYRVEPEEVEHALAANPGVVDAAVLPTDDHQHLVACVVVADSADPPTADELRADLKRQLPPYLVPGRFLFLPLLPRTAIGKLDRAAIAAVVRGESDRVAEDRTHEEPSWSDREAVIAAIWESVIGIPRVGRTDDFFDIGGHSLLATRVTAAIREACDVDLPVRAVFDHRTVPELAVAVAGCAATARRRIPVDTNAVRVASFQQRRLWFLDRLDPGGAAYTIPFSYRLEGPLDEPALRRALTWLVERHEALRTSFVTVDGEPVPVIATEADVQVAVDDTSGRPDPVAAARTLVEADAGTPFDLAGGPLYRFRLVRLGPDDHLFAVAVHHAVFDGLSRWVFEEDLSTAYGCFRRRTVPTPDPEPMRYTDFAAWQRNSVALAEHTAYWRDEFDDAPVRVPLRRRARRSASGAAESVRFTVAPSVVRRLTAHARGHGTTLSTAALACFHALLSRYSDSTDIITGTSVAGRSRPELQNVIGCFVNTVAIRTSVTDDSTYTGHLSRTRDAVLNALSHEDMPFEALVEELAPVRDSDSNPIFQIWFDFWDESATGKGLALPGCRATPVRLPFARVRFDVELHLKLCDGDVLEGTLVYADGMFDPDMMLGFANHYERLLAAVAADPERPVGTIPLPSPDGPDRAVPTTRVPGGTVTDWFADVARRRPDATAVTHNGREIRYGELDVHSGRLATLLRGRGVGPETVVALVVPRGIELIAAMLAVGKAGAAYLPVDPDLPAERVSFMLRDAGAGLALTSACRATFTVPTVDLDDTDLTAYPACSAPSRATDATLAYVLYTSGSTGFPKGTAVTHGSLANLVHWHRTRYRLGPADRVSQTASMSFDASTWEIWPALTSGARLCLPDDHDRSSPEGLLQHFTDSGTTSAFVPTPLAENLIQRPLGRTTRLRHLLTGGDVLRCPAGREPGVPVVNHYGPTENTVVATASAPFDVLPEEPPIGAAIDNCRTYVLDGRGQPVPPYVTGEIFVGGRGVARGYVSRPDLTAASFLPDPLAGTPGARMYRTGDLGWLDSAGVLHFAGRADQQIKIHGYRIEPAEVAAAVMAHPDVTDAVVLAAEGRLLAYVVGWPDQDFRRLCAHLRQRLPHYMVPHLFVAVDEFPRTASDKVDVSRLPAPPAVSTNPFVEPRNDQERVLAELWGELLDVPRIGVHDDFFVLGGHSLSAVKLVERVRNRFGVAMPVRAVFDHRTIAELAEAVHAAVLADIEAMSDDQVAVVLATPPTER